MTVDARLSVAITVAIPFFLAVAGGILAVRTLPDANLRERTIWIAVFVGLFFVGLVLSVIQQVRMTTQQTLAESAAHDKDVRIEGDAKYTQGQLESINKVISSLVLSNTSTQEVKDILRGIQSTTKNTSQAPVATSNRVGLRGFSNEELKAKVGEMTAKLRALDNAMILYTDPHQTTRAYQNQQDQWNFLHVECAMLVEEMTSRLPAGSYPTAVGSIQAELTQGVLFGARPLQEISSYMERLALLLPAEKKKSKRLN